MNDDHVAEDRMAGGGEMTDRDDRERSCVLCDTCGRLVPTSHHGPCPCCGGEVWKDDWPDEIVMTDAMADLRDKAIRDHGAGLTEPMEDTPRPTLSPEEEAEAQQLYAKLLENIANGNTWGLSPKEDV